jgi:hypothetical protein
MRCRFLTICAAIFVVLPLVAQTNPPSGPNQAAVVAFAEKTAVEAVNFQQGDAASFAQARADFTSDGWKDFLKHTEGFLDQKGAPTFTSSFVPSTAATVLDRENGRTHVRIVGTLDQTQNQSRTTYKAAIEVYVGGDPVKIQRLEQITCIGASTACQ